jgi:hypothetical protein
MGGNKRIYWGARERHALRKDGNEETKNMVFRWGSSSGEVRPCLLLVLIALSLLVSFNAGAYTYDDFNGNSIDSAKWTSSGIPGLFSQSGGRLHFNATNAAASLVSTRTFKTGFFSMEFY